MSTRPNNLIRDWGSFLFAGVALILSLATFYFSFLHEDNDANLYLSSLSGSWDIDADGSVIDYDLRGDIVVSNSGTEPIVFVDFITYLAQSSERGSMDGSRLLCDQTAAVALGYGFLRPSEETAPVLIQPGDAAVLKYHVSRFRHLNEEQAIEAAASGPMMAPLENRSRVHFAVCLEAILFLSDGTEISRTRFLRDHTAGDVRVNLDPTWQFFDEGFSVPEQP